MFAVANPVGIRSEGADMVWTRTGERERLVVIDVDTQNHFFRDDSPIHVRNHRRVLGNIERILAWAWANHIHTISTIHAAGRKAVWYASFLARGLTEQKPGGTLCPSSLDLAATDGTDLPWPLMEQYDQVIVHKRCCDPFDEPRAERLLTELEADTFVVVGTPTEGAVRVTALGLLARGKNVMVVADAIGSLSASFARRALQKMQIKGARLVDTEILLGHGGRAGRTVGLRLRRLPAETH
jgi:nicotinamidase-related amidase